uniref:Uncharacterized protein n=1 Tax=Anguilla anguilla TaxID=7936 RepID=A0A0E9Q176_ANGAN
MRLGNKRKTARDIGQTLGLPKTNFFGTSLRREREHW